MDTYWITYPIYIPIYTKGFKRKIAEELADLDFKLLSLPDVTIYLKPTEKVMKDYMRKRKRDWEKDKGFWKLMVKVKEAHEEFFEKNKIKNLIVVDKSKMDFEREEDFKELISQIDEKINLA